MLAGKFLENKKRKQESVENSSTENSSSKNNSENDFEREITILKKEIFNHLNDEKIFKKLAEEKIKQAIENITSKSSPKTFQKLSDINNAIITFAGHKIRLINNLNNPEKVQEISKQLELEFAKLLELLSINFDDKQ